MSNLYGVANPGPLPLYSSTIGGIDIACPAGTETNVISVTPNPVFLPGNYFAYACGVLWVSLGATPPSALNIALRVNSGADITTVSTYNPALVANANLALSYFLVGTGTPIQNPAPASTIQVSVTSGAQTSTVRNFVSYAWIQWFRGPD